MGEPIQFDAIYDDALLEDATRRSVHRWYSRYGWLIASACIVNYAGIAAYIWFAGFRVPLIAVMPLVIVVVAPFYFVWSYFWSPKMYATALKRVLVPSAPVVVDSSSVSIAMGSRRLTNRWSELANAVELPEYFLLLRHPFSLVAIPIAKKGATEEALQVIREAVRRYRRPF